MKLKISTSVALALAMFLVGAVCASADTLELRDGRVIRGKFMGGTESTVRMEIDGTVRSFPISQVIALSFSESSGGSLVPAEAHPEAPVRAPLAAAPPATAPQPDTSQKYTIPAGTRILVRMIDSVDSSRNRVGDRFRASLEANLESDGIVVVPRGTEVVGRLAEAKEAGHLSGHSELKLELTDLRIGDDLVPIVTGEYELAGKNRGGNTAAKTVGGAAIGAVIGAIAGGGRGAAIGAGVGGGAGATVNIITRGEQVKVPSETMIEFRLEQALTTRPALARPR
jgi:hypothetical protein